LGEKASLVKSAHRAEAVATAAEAVTDKEAATEQREKPNKNPRRQCNSTNHVRNQTKEKRKKCIHSVHHKERSKNLPNE